ncbi:mRNA cleavage factor subunit-like protein [Arabidopsis thaliana]|nr:mRNA cleavage factor subunit-like protein [Arabidopsis thaliana]CAB79740.1 mRNA cleavage factor subunit-like protein [Arabidopsis thaliana]
MGEEARALDMEEISDNTTRRNDVVHDLMVDLYPLSSYYFGSKEALRVKDEIISDRHPHVLLLQYRNSIFKLPGGRLRPGESGLVCCFLASLCINIAVGECIGMWWRPNFETLMYPFLPPNIKHPKECTKLFLVRLPVHQQFVVPKNFKLLAVPLCQLHENEKTYGPIMSQIPKLLSKFSFNMMEI